MTARALRSHLKAILADVGTSTLAWKHAAAALEIIDGPLLRAQRVRAHDFRIAVDALREIADIDDESGNPEDWERCYGAGKEIAEDALRAIEASDA